MTAPGPTYDDLVEIYKQLEDYQPPKPIKLTRWQRHELATYLEEHTDSRTFAATAVSQMQTGAPWLLTGVPVVIVETEEESTPYEQGWNWTARSASGA